MSDIKLVLKDKTKLDKQKIPKELVGKLVLELTQEERDKILEILLSMLGLLDKDGRIK